MTGDDFCLQGIGVYASRVTQRVGLGVSVSVQHAARRAARHNQTKGFRCQVAEAFGEQTVHGVVRVLEALTAHPALKIAYPDIGADQLKRGRRRIG